MYKNIEKIYRERLLSKKPILNENNIQLSYLLNYLPKDKNAIILDAGCGNGNYAFHFKEQGYRNIYAVDLFANINTNKFIYKQSSIDNLPFGDKKFDSIYSNSVIYYLENPEDGIREFKRVLRDEGIVIFTAHTKYSLFTIWRLFKRDVLKLKEMEHLGGVKFYSANYYKKILEKNGFELLLQDGYEVSFFIYPFYKKIVRAFDKYLNIRLSILKAYQSSGILGKIKAEIAYHSVFVVRKKND